MLAIKFPHKIDEHHDLWLGSVGSECLCLLLAIYVGGETDIEPCPSLGMLFEKHSLIG